jgi:hypothetical protein
MDRPTAWGLLTVYACPGRRSARKQRLAAARRWWYAAALVFVLMTGGPAQPAPEPATALLDRLAGHWMLNGRLGRKQVTHDIDAEWVLKREYLRLHEVSRETNADGTPLYEAIIYFMWDPKAREYDCLWLDNTEGGGLAAPIAKGKKEGDSISLMFGAAPDAIHTVFGYDAHTDSWQLTIDNISGDKTERFGDARLTRARK